MATVYKVVTARMVDDQENWFSNLDGILGDWNVCYRPGRRVLPPIPGSYLYAFRTQNQAQTFADKTVRLGDSLMTPLVQPQIWIAEAEIVTVEKPTQAFVDFEAFWKLHLHAVDMQHDECTPTAPGTVWCRWMILDEMVWGVSPDMPKPKAKKVQARKPLTVQR